MPGPPEVKPVVVAREPGCDDLKPKPKHNANFRHLQAAAKQLGAVVDMSTRGAGFVNMDAPDGYVWAASFTHALNCDAGSPHGHAGRINWSDAIEDCLDRMQLGLEPERTDPPPSEAPPQVLDCREPGCDDLKPKPKHMRDPRWLYAAVRKPGKVREAQAIGRRLPLHSNMLYWSTKDVDMVVAALVAATTAR